MTEAEIKALQELLGAFREENKDDHNRIFTLIAGLAARQDKMNGGLSAVKWIISAVIAICVPFLVVILAQGL